MGEIGGLEMENGGNWGVGDGEWGKLGGWGWGMGEIGGLGMVNGGNWGVGDGEWGKLGGWRW